MNRNEIINRVAAVVLAIVLWVYVISVVNPPTTVTIRQVPVALQNTDYLDESKLAIAGDGKYTVDVQLSGKRKDLILSPSDLTATADLSGLTPGQNYITVKVTSPSNTTVTEIRTEKIQVYVDELVMADKPVVLDVQNVPSGTEFSVLSLDHESITVSGAKSLVDMVDQIKVSVDAAGREVDEIEKKHYAVSPVDSEGNPVKAVSLASSYVDLSSTLYTVKSVPLYTKVDGLPGLGIELLSSNIPSSVSIKGTLLSLAKVNYIDAEPLNIEGITTNTELTVVPILPEGIALASGNGSMIASFTLSESGSVQFETSSADVVLEDLPEGFSAQLAEEPSAVKVTVSGAIDAISGLKAEDLTYYVSLTDVKEAGEFSFPIYSRTTSGEVLAVVTDPAQLTVLIEEQEQAPDAEE
ncbi:MAG: hypothetical protein IKN20_06650 [Firmicutes bacterium]|nr:hypothetical protein [Bacillota bacterium]